MKWWVWWAIRSDWSDLDHPEDGGEDEALPRELRCGCVAVDQDQDHRLEFDDGIPDRAEPRVGQESGQNSAVGVPLQRDDDSRL